MADLPDEDGGGRRGSSGGGAAAAGLDDDDDERCACAALCSECPWSPASSPPSPSPADRFAALAAHKRAMRAAHAEVRVLSRLLATSS